MRVEGFSRYGFEIPLVALDCIELSFLHFLSLSRTHMHITHTHTQTHKHNTPLSLSHTHLYADERTVERIGEQSHTHTHLHADERTVERIGEQLGALKSQITEDIRANVMLRKEVVLVHKQPGYPGMYPPPHMTCIHVSSSSHDMHASSSHRHHPVAPCNKGIPSVR